MVQAVALRGSAARAWLISLSASSNRLVNKLAAARSTCASATSSKSRDLRENLAASGYAASKRRNFPISRSPRATIFSLAAAAADKSPASFAEFAAANRRSNSSSGDAGFCCALACRHPRTASRKRHAPRADRLQRMTFEDREGGVWIKAECPRLVPKSTRLAANCSSRGIWREIPRGRVLKEGRAGQVGILRCASNTRLVAAGSLLLVVPNLHGPHSRLFANEASAVGKLRTIVQLQNEYTARRENRGFACNLPLLKPIGQQKF